VRAAVPIGQTLDKSDSGFGSRLIEGIPFNQYAALNNLTIKEGRNLEKGDEVIIDYSWKNEKQVEIGSTTMIYERPFRIVGVYEPPGGGRLKIPLSTMQDQVGSENRCNAILIAVNDPARQDDVGRRSRRNSPKTKSSSPASCPRFTCPACPRSTFFSKW
jgi:putative ABC transport system permease protein